MTSLVSVSKKKVSIVLPPVSDRKISSREHPLFHARKISLREQRDRARTYSLKSVSTISEAGSENEHRIERQELRKMRYSTLLGLPTGFTLEGNHGEMIQSFKRQSNFRLQRECKSIINRPIRHMNDFVPILSFRAAVTCLVLNVIFPGLGTLTSAFLCLFFPSNNSIRENRWSFFTWNLLIGVTQAVGVVYLLIGYFWGIIWGVYMVRVSEHIQDSDIVPMVRGKINSVPMKSSFRKAQKIAFIGEEENVNNNSIFRM